MNIFKFRDQLIDDYQSYEVAVIGGITPRYFLASILNFCISRMTLCFSSGVRARR